MPTPPQNPPGSPIPKARHMQHWTRRKSLHAIGALALGSAGCAHAQGAWPARPLTWVVGYPPGGGSDTMARIVASRMAPLLGQSIVVDNRPGGAGQIAAAYVARSAADGYTLLIDASSFAINLGLGLRLAYSAQSFATVGLLAFFPLVVVAHPGFSARSMADVIALAKARPGEVFFASAGNGSVQQIMGALLMQAAGIELTHVPYKGAGPALNDVMGGQVPLFFANPAVRAGKLRALAVTGSHRLAELPEVPTLAETPAGDVQLREWNGMFVPAATPAAVLERLSAALRHALDDEDVKRRVAALSGEVFDGSRADAVRFVDGEISAMGRVIRERGIKAQ
jgi:tripartite-type tricarboxylate transporter receptor subunit TctC